MKKSHLFIQYYKSVFGFLTILFLCFTTLSAQEGIRLNTEEAFEGYTLCNIENDKEIFLLDNCGEIVNKWNNIVPEHHCKLTDEGNLLYIQSNTIVEKDWNGTTIFSTSPNSNEFFLLYEVIKLENGNYLAVSRRFVNNSDYEEIGWDPFIPKPNYIDGVVEIAPNGDVVWEWNMKDHTIQDKRPSAPNYGNVKDHPELVDVNSISDYDWQYGESFMINGMDYNPELDQIVVSVRKVSEIMIIDHSTTTEEARGSTGGRYGKGGDILYRWGNPQNYRQGTEADRVLYYQHNPNWIKYGEHTGKIIMYNNGLTRGNTFADRFSSVHIIDTPINGDGSYALDPNQAFEPEEADVTIDKESTGNDYYSGYTSSAQVLPNGNIYITVGLPSDFIEVTHDGTVVWEYSLDESYIFRSEKYPLDFPGFEGKDLTPNGTVEFPSSPYVCDLFTSTNELEAPNSFSITFDQLTSFLTFSDLETRENIMVITDMQGQTIKSMKNVDNKLQLQLSDIPSGMYLVTLIYNRNRIKQSRKFVKF